MRVLPRLSVIFTGLAVLLLALAFSNRATAQTGLDALNSDRPDAMLIMDFSGSMWGQVNGRAKFQIADDIIQQRFDGWNESLNLGVLAYGHRRKGDCRDIELAFRPGSSTPRDIRGWLARQRPVGKTPLGGSLIAAAGYFNSKGQEANLIILSDGIESCGQDPCRVIQDLQAQGAQMTAHVIGFDLNENDTNALRCIADLTGGTYVGADRADQLEEGFRKAVEAIVDRDDGTEQALRQSLNDSLDALRDAADLLDAANRRADQNAALLADARDEIARLNDIVADRDATIAELAAALRDCEDEVARLQNALANAEQTIDDQARMIAQLEDALADALGDLDQARLAIGSLEDQVDSLQDQLSDRERLIDQLTDQIAALEAEIARLNEELAEALRNRQITVSSLDFGAFEGTSEPVDIAALVAERDAYLGALQQLRQNLGFVLDPLSQAQAIANSVPQEANPVAVPAERNEVKILLAASVEGELPDLQWSLRGTQGDAVGRRDVGTGARINLPPYAGTFEIMLRLPGIETELTVESDPARPMSRDIALDVGRLSLSLPGSQTGLFFTSVMNDAGQDVARTAIETEGSLYLKPGLYTVETRLDGGEDVFDVQIFAGKETAVPLRF